MPDTTKQSTLVTVVAWMALIFSGFATATGLLQSILLLTVMPFEPFSAADAANTPPLFRFLFDHFQAFVLSNTVFWGATFACAFGLLRRQDWARRGFIALLVTAAIGSALIAVFQQALMGEMFATAGGAPAEAGAMILTMRIASAVFALAFTGGFLWIAFQLRSATVLAEFGRA